MKTLFKSILFVAAALSFASCNQKEVIETPNDNELVTLKFNIRNADESTTTKAVLGTESGKNFINWENGDKIGTFSVGTFGDNASSNNNAGTIEVNGEDYILNVQTFNAGTVTNIYSYYPYSSAVGKKKEEANISIPESQYMDANGFVADAMPMAGSPIEVDLSTTANTDTPCGTINFSNLGSLINFKVYSSSATDETLTSLQYISKSGNLGGEYTINLSTIDTAEPNSLILKGEGTKSAITTFFRTAPAIGTGKDNAVDVYMVVAPGTYSETQVVVTTNLHTYTLTASGEKTYERSHVKPMNIDIQKGEIGSLSEEETWNKVTSAEDFTSGIYYILRADGKKYVPNTIVTGGQPTCADYATGDPVTDAMKWKAKKSGDGLIFESYSSPGNYLWTNNTGSTTSIRVTKSPDGNAPANVWTFAQVAKNNNIYYTATAGNDRYLASNADSDWRYYTSGNFTEKNIPAEFYKLENSEDPGDEPGEDPGIKTEHEGTLDDPFSVADAKAYIDGNGTEKVYVKGVISEIIYTFDVEHGTATFWISEDGRSNDFEAYSIYYLENKSWQENYSQIELGDEVILYGTLIKYNEIYETKVKDAYIYSLNGVTTIEGGNTDPGTDPEQPGEVKEYVDVLNNTWTAVGTGTTYTDWTKNGSASEAVYVGQSAGGNSSIQIRSDKSNSGIVTTVSGGSAKKIVVKWNSNTTNGRTLDIYGSNSAYTAPTDLYSTSTQGTKIGSLEKGTTELVIEGNYTYIGLRSNSGAMYLDEIQITWEK